MWGKEARGVEPQSHVKGAWCGVYNSHRLDIRSHTCTRVESQAVSALALGGSWQTLMLPGVADGHERMKP